MKKPFIFLAALLVMSGLLSGCNKSGKLNAKSEFTPPSGPMEFKLKWPLGQRVEQEMDMKMTMEMNIPSQPAPIKQDMTMGEAYGLTVLQAGTDGTHEIEMDFLSVRMGMKSGEKVMLDYDSTKKVEGGKENPLGDLFGKMVGSKIWYYLDASNAVDRIEGVNEMMNKLSAGAPPQTLASLKGMFNEGYFKQMMSANLFLPSKPVQPGDTWPVQMDVPLGEMGTMTMNYDFTFVRWEMHGKRNCARLEFQGTIKSKDDSKPNAAGMSISMQDGTTSGVSWFDPELGITIDTSLNQTMKMLIHTPANPRAKGPAAKPQIITSTIDQAIVLKLVSVK